MKKKAGEGKENKKQEASQPKAEVKVEKERRGDKIDYDTCDLNKLGEDELAAHKKKMDEVFYKNYKDPQSKEFVYEVEKNFDHIEKVDDSWDS